MKTIAAILLCAVSFATVAPSTASAGDVDKWVRMGLSIANNARTAKKLVQNVNGNGNNEVKKSGLLGRVSLNPQPLPPRKLLRRR
jgi:hypothetical protein